MDNYIRAELKLDWAFIRKKKLRRLDKRQVETKALNINIALVKELRDFGSLKENYKKQKQFRRFVKD